MLAKNEKLIDHISKLIMHVEDNFASTHNNAQILSTFEKLSVNIKNNNMGITTMKSQKPYLTPKDRISAPKHTHKNGTQNFTEDNETILNQVGLGLADKEAILVNYAINEHRTLEGIDFEFFGKLFTAESDYYVIYGYRDGKLGNQKPLCSHMESEGEGVNAFIVYVTTSKHRGTWVKLPAVLPRQIRLSKRMKSVFKGDLNTYINTYGFDGTEAHLLKCQFVRILSATKLVAKGIYTINEETGKVEVDAESVKDLQLSKEDALSLENWVYIYPYILKGGRVTHFIPSHRNEEEVDELKDKLDEKDKLIERLSSALVEDQKIWQSYPYNKEDETFNVIKDGETLQTSYNFVIIRHNDWEGAYTVFSVEQQRSVFLYRGYGLKKSQPVLPVNILKIDAEPKQKHEVDEPNHYEPPKDNNEEDNGDNIDNDNKNSEDNDVQSNKDEDN